jgi:predicted MFS family arabinose efflux permease
LTRFRALRHPSFRLLWSVVVLGQLGYWFSSISFQWVIAQRTGNDPLALGLLYFCGLAPYLLFSLPAGVLADAADRRRLLVAVQVASVAFTAAAAALAVLAALPTPAVMALSFVAGCVITITSPASNALTAEVVPREDLASAVPMQSAGLNLARITGPALAGPVLLAAGPSTALGVCVALAVGALALARQISVPDRHPARARTETVWQRLAAGVNHARQRPPAVAALITVATTSIVGSSYTAQLPVIAARVSDNGGTAFVMLAALGGAGSLAAALTVAGQGRPTGVGPAAWRLMILGGVVALLGWVRSFPVTALLLILGGALTFLVMISMNSLLQHLVDDAQRGRVMSLYFVAWGGLLPIGGLGLGALARLAGPGPAFGLYGGLAVLAGLVIAVHNRHAPPATA